METIKSGFRSRFAMAGDPLLARWTPTRTFGRACCFATCSAASMRMPRGTRPPQQYEREGRRPLSAPRPIGFDHSHDLYYGLQMLWHGCAKRGPPPLTCYAQGGLYMLSRGFINWAPPT